jgi:hypothetical protein
MKIIAKKVTWQYDAKHQSEKLNFTKRVDHLLQRRGTSRIFHWGKGG